MTPARIPFMRPEFDAETRAAITGAIDGILSSGRLMNGEWTRAFEAQFRDATGCAHAVSLNSATTGLQIALGHYGVKGRDVLVPAGSFLTDVGAVVMAGGNPVLVDIDPETLAFDLADLARKKTANTAGIVWVHLTGIIAPNYREIIAFARDNGLFLVEDACHAHGAVIDGRPAGSLGDVGIFSFYPTKVVTAGTGGMLTTNDDALATYATEMRMFGKRADGEIVHLGNDWFLDEIRAAVGHFHMGCLADQLARRRAIAARYFDGLANQPGLRLLDRDAIGEPSWYHFTTFLDEAIDYDAFAARLREVHGVETKRIYRPVHREEIFRHLDDGTLQGTERALDRSLCLPMFPAMTMDEVDRVVAAVIAELRAAQ